MRVCSQNSAPQDVSALPLELSWVFLGWTLELTGCCACAHELCLTAGECFAFELYQDPRGPQYVGADLPLVAAGLWCKSPGWWEGNFDQLNLS